MARIRGLKDLLPDRMTFRAEDDFGNTEISDEDEREYNIVFDFLKNKENWKMPTKEFTTNNVDLAGTIAEVLTFFTGGAEITFIGEGTFDGGVTFRRALITISSRGYYHYIGV